MSLRKYSFFFFLLLVSGFCHENKICVTMVVKNHELTIEKCLQSVREIADCIAISDAGCTDHTLELIEKFLKLTGIPGKIYQRNVENLDSIPVICADAAKKTLKNCGFNLSQSYLLILEPDQIITQKSLFSDTLVEASYMLLEHSTATACSHFAPRLFRASLSIDDIQFDVKRRNSKKVRSLLVEDAMPEFPISSIIDLNEEEKKEIWEAHLKKVKQDKLTQTIERYSEALKSGSQNSRFLFYVANAYKALKQHREAIALYTKQANQGGEKEDVWFAKYMIGECYEETGSWVDALYWYLEAYQVDPKRAESLRKIATYYRLQGETDLAYIFAKHGLRIPKAEEALLFPSEPLRDYQFDEEVSVAAYYTRFKQEGYEASNDLLLRRDIPPHIREQGYRNLLFYIQNIKARFVPIELSLPPIRSDSAERYYPMNPSLLKTKDGYKLICRAVNYTQKGAKHFSTNDEAGIFRTKNFLVTYDRTFKKIGEKEIVESLERAHWRDYIVQGLEDCRLFHWQGSDWFTCSTFDTNPTGAVQISLGKMRKAEGDLPIQVESLLPLKGPDPHRHEKNWLPFVQNGELFLVYSADPFVIYKPDLQSGECTPVLEYTPSHDFSRFRGSAPPVEFDGGYLMLVHEVFHFPDYSRCYVHRFVFLDSTFRVKKVSKPFTFNHSGIEYCLAMTLDHEGKEMVMPIGIEDKEAYLMFVDLNEIRAMLQPLPTTYTPF